MPRVGFLRHPEQRHHPADPGVAGVQVAGVQGPGDRRGHGRAVQGGRDRHRDHLGPGCGHRPRAPLRKLVPGRRTLRYYEQPPAGQRRRPRGGQGCPADLVPPCRGDRPVPFPPPPGSQRREHLTERGAAVHGQRVRERAHVAAVHRRPEPGLGPGRRALRGRLPCDRRPEPLPLERVGRQLRPPPGGQHRRPVHRHPGHVHPGQRAEQRRRRGLPGPLHRYEHGLPVRVGQGREAKRRQGPVGPDFEERPDAAPRHDGDRIGEPDRLPCLPHPVTRLAFRHQVPGQAADPRHRRRLVVQPARDSGKLVQDQVHPRGVERVGNPQFLGTDTARREPGRHLGDRLGVAGNHHRSRAIDRRDRHCVTSGQRGGHLGFGGSDGAHRAALRQVLHQPGAGRYQRAGVLQRQHPGGVGGRDLADRVAGDRLGGDPGPGQQRHQRRLHREQPCLGEQRLVGALGVGLAEYHVGDRLTQLVLQQRARLVEDFREHGDAACRPAAIPARWEPWPENRNPTIGSPATVPAVTPGAGRPAATAARPAISSSRSWPVTIARCANADRVRARDQPTSAGSSSGRAVSHSPSRPA